MLVWLTLTYAGFAASLRLKKRKSCLSQVLLFLSAVKVEIEFTLLPLCDIIDNLLKENVCGELDFLFCVREKTEGGMSFKQAWESSVRESSLPIKHEEREKLLSLGALLGTSDCKGQKAVLSLYGEFFGAYCQAAQSACERYSKMYMLSGFLSGAFVFIIFL